MRSDAKTFSSFQNRILLTELYRTYSLRDAVFGEEEHDSLESSDYGQGPHSSPPVLFHSSSRPHLLSVHFLDLVHPIGSRGMSISASTRPNRTLPFLGSFCSVASVLEAIYQTHVSLSPTLLCFTLQAPFLVTIYIQNPCIGIERVVIRSCGGLCSALLRLSLLLY